MFPIDVTNGIPNDATKVGSVTIRVTGDTTYNEGVEYLVSAVNVQNTVNNKTVPISIDVGVTSNTYGEEPNQTTTTLVTSDNDYFTNRGTTANTSIYKVLAGETINTNDQLLVGYIKSGETGVDGNIVIRAYLDKARIAISDTYPEGDVTHTEGEEPNQVTVTDYTNGTTSTWVGDRTVFTTTEWNSLQANGVSFQVKVETWNTYKDASLLNNWNVSNVENFTNMFYVSGDSGAPSDFTYPSFTLRPGIWDNTPIDSGYGWNDYAGTYVPNN